MAAKNENLFSILKEIVIVLIGVLMALFINDWRENNRNEKYVQSILQAVEKDIQHSKESIQEVMARHELLIDSHKYYYKDQERTVVDIVLDMGGIQYPAVKNISLRFLVANRAELVDYELISLLTDIEMTKGLLDTKFEKLMDFAYSGIDNAEMQTKEDLMIHLENVIDSEDSLLELYEEYLKGELKK